MCGGECMDVFITSYPCIWWRRDTPPRVTGMTKDTISNSAQKNQRVGLSRFSCVQFFVTPWITAPQDLLSMGFSREEHWNGLLFPPPRDLPHPEIEPLSSVIPALQADSSPLEPPRKTISSGSVITYTQNLGKRIQTMCLHVHVCPNHVHILEPHKGYTWEQRELLGTVEDRLCGIKRVRGPLAPVGRYGWFIWIALWVGRKLNPTAVE